VRRGCGAIYRGDTVPRGESRETQVFLLAGATASASVGLVLLVIDGPQEVAEDPVGYVRSLSPRHDVSMLVLAAGGIADGQAVAEALAHGADGVWVGTRLVASIEANAHDEYKRRIVRPPGVRRLTRRCLARSGQASAYTC
jgi:hypothetical protein